MTARLVSVGLAIFFLAVTANAACLQYEPAIVTVTGVLVVKQAYGPPNYGENPATDSTERYVVLVLDESTCVDANPSNELDDVEERDVRAIQLVTSDGVDGFLLNKRVAVSGTLFHAHTGHHRTPVLIRVKTIALSRQPGRA